MAAYEGSSRVPVHDNEESLLQLHTERLTLIPFRHDLVQATMEDRAAIGRLLDVAVPVDWPGPDLEEILPSLADWLAGDPARAEWTCIIMQTQDRTLIGSAGFKDEPDSAGVVEIGYGIVPAYRRQGYAAEAGRALIAWALAQPGVTCVTAECLYDNLPSIRVLERLGMRQTGRDGDLLQWELPIREGG